MQRIPHRALFIAAENDTTFAEKNANNMSAHIAKHHFSNDIALLSHVSIFIRIIYYLDRLRNAMQINLIEKHIH